ncbi:hypothetical protein RFI_20851 [Reticulomyxa filosa]|uniref:Cleavage/polyadenylation specificity factor A subunit C-terminal domain-containing protein n=1 Tax=Reticulomyxa filosa TaxID=46433 RepID=X6MS48_RETFI|nr:hypothetical protein RFI_20851 [Reticulomyxa filosa]|eukprot:ETO16491.1 hypothetical protein RFI_20851 [Reticulomyxa filosa]
MMSSDGSLVCMDESNRFVLCHNYRGLISVIELDSNGHLVKPQTTEQDVIVYELDILSLAIFAVDMRTQQSIDQSEKERTQSHSSINEQKTNELKNVSSIDGDNEKKDEKEEWHLTIGILYQDYNASRHLKTYRLNVNTLRLCNGSSDTLMAEDGCHTLIRIPAAQRREMDNRVGAGKGGVILIGGDSITYCTIDDAYQQIQVQAQLQLPHGIYTAYDIVNPLHTASDSNCRFLIGDAMNRKLNLMTLKANSQNEVKSMEWKVLGDVVSPSCISYLGNDKCFVGSVNGDHQLIMIHDNSTLSDEVDVNAEHLPEKCKDDKTIKEQGGESIEILQEFENIDMCAVDLERQGQCQLVCCSGIGKDGSLRVVRNGIGIEETAAIEMPGIEGLWSLYRDSSSSFHLYLAQSFISATRVLTVTEEGLEEIEMQGLNKDEKTVHLENMNHDLFIQVTPYEVALLSIHSPFALKHRWRPQHYKQTQINSAVSNRDQVLCALSGGHLSLLEIDSKSSELILTNSVTLENEISCVCLSPTATANDKSTFACIGLWKQHVIQLLTLPDFHKFYTFHLQTQMVPRSVLITNFTCPGLVQQSKSASWLYLFVGMGDGSLVEAHVNISHSSSTKTPCVELLKEKRLSLGSHPIRLSSFVSLGNYYVFAGCDRPSVISRSKQRIYGSPTTAYGRFHGSISKNSRSKSPFEFCKNSLLFLNYLKKNKFCYFCDTTRKRKIGVKKDLFHPHWNPRVTRLHLLHDQTFEPLFSKTLRSHWSVNRIITHTFQCDPNVTYFIISLSKALPHQCDVSKGKLELYIVSNVSSRGDLSVHSDNDNTKSTVTPNTELMLQRVHQQVFSQASPDAIAALRDNYLLLGVSSHVYVFEWTRNVSTEVDAYPFTLKHLQTLTGNVRVVDIKTCGDFIMVVDQIQSIAMYVFSPSDNTVQEIARHRDLSWLRKVVPYDDQFVVAVDKYDNLLVLMRNIDTANNDERSTLQVLSRCHLGSQANVLIKGFLAIQHTSEDASSSSDALLDKYQSTQPHPEHDKKDQERDTKVGDETTFAKDYNGIWDLSPLQNSQLKRYLFGTIDGSIGLLLSIPQARFKLLARLEKVLNAHIDGVGGFKGLLLIFFLPYFFVCCCRCRHNYWRKFKVEGKRFPSVGFIDGDIVQKFLEFAPEMQQQIAQEVDIDVNSLISVVEEINRIL